MVNESCFSDNQWVICIMVCTIVTFTGSFWNCLSWNRTSSLKSSVATLSTSLSGTWKQYLERSYMYNLNHLLWETTYSESRFITIGKSKTCHRLRETWQKKGTSHTSDIKVIFSENWLFRRWSTCILSYDCNNVSNTATK